MISPLNQDTKKIRLLSLDVFRGVTVAAMILVNNPGDWGHIYAPLEHSAWNGCTPTDLIFPFFLFIVGVSIVFAMESQKADPANHRKMILGALRRGILLILIGWSINLFYKHSLTHLRFPGVLPRIGLVYFICSLIYIKTNAKYRDWIFPFVLIAYYLIMVFIPVPGQGYATLEPETNLGAWLDRIVFTSNHLYGRTKTWDPEGLLGTLPALGTTLFGIIVGTCLKKTDDENRVKVKRLLSYGIIAVLAGLLWDQFFPINKSLWTSSYVLYTGGLATIGLTLTYWLVDIKGYKKVVWPFVVFGMNAITAFALSGILIGLINFIPAELNGKTVTAGAYFYKTTLVPYFSPNDASLIRAIVYVLVIWVMMLYLYRKKIFIKV